MASFRKAFEYHGSAVAEYDDYTVVVEDGEEVKNGTVIHDPNAGDIEVEPEIVSGYWLMVSKGAMPPHATYFFRTLEEIEDYERSGELFGRTDLDWHANDGEPA